MVLNWHIYRWRQHRPMKKLTNTWYEWDLIV
jgi:hypothetical protein